MHEEPTDFDPEARRELDDAWSHLDDGDLEAAWRALVGLQDAAAGTPDVLALEAELALAEDDPEAALDAYRRWSTTSPEDPEPWIASAGIYLEYYDDAGDAARLLRELLAGPELDPTRRGGRTPSARQRLRGEERPARHGHGVAGRAAAGRLHLKPEASPAASAVRADRCGRLGRVAR